METKQSQNKGFALLEALITLSIIVILQQIVVQMFTLANYDHVYFTYDYLYTQSVSLKDICENDLISDFSGTSYIHFYSNGNINHAQTITFNNNKKTIDIVAELGGGRLVLK